MNERESEICEGILICLNRVAPGQLDEAIIHADVQTQFRNRQKSVPSLAEFNRAIVICDQRGWAIGVSSQIKARMKWSITDQGNAALAQF